MKILKSIQKVASASAGVTLGLLCLHANQTQAATIAYEFSISIQDGPLIGETYRGSFEYDDETLNGSGFEQVRVSAFLFDFLGVEYTEADVPGALVTFDNGFQGLELQFGEFLGGNPPSYLFSAGFAISPAAFAYDVSNGLGNGGITYTLAEQPPESPPENPAVSVPEPATGVALLMLAPFGVLSGLKRQR